MELFDLNIEEVLEHWAPRDAVREIIANAIDEQVVSGTRPISIGKNAQGAWIIRDYGRGIQIEHFTQNESKEKLASNRVIGKFGVGLKDALAACNRHAIRVEIRSRHGKFTLVLSQKHGFEAISTLHVGYERIDDDFEGTAVVLRGVADDEVAAAKALFLLFSGDRKIEATRYGEILAKREGVGRIYVRGVLVNIEDNFAYSYNITDLTASMRKRLNRERSDVGRTVYGERVKSILKVAESEEVKAELVRQAQLRGSGVQADELSWIEVSQRALTLLNQSASVTYVTESEVATTPHLIDEIQRDGHAIVVITDQQHTKLSEQAASGGPAVRLLHTWVSEWNASFEYQFVSPQALRYEELQVLNQMPQLFELAGIPKHLHPGVRISETIRASVDDSSGVWDRELGCIVLRRDVLSSVENAGGTALHELAHAVSGAHDNTREFEAVMTVFLGRLAAELVQMNELAG